MFNRHVSNHKKRREYEGEESVAIKMVYECQEVEKGRMPKTK